MADCADPLFGLDEPEPSWAGAVTWRQTDSLRDELFRLLQAPGTMEVRLDVRAVTSIDAAGIGVLVGANHRAAAAGRRMVLIDSNGPVTATLSRLHLLGQFHVTQVIAEGDALTSAS